MAEAIYFSKFSEKGQIVLKFICSWLKYVVYFTQELPLRKAGLLKLVAWQAFIKPNFAFMFLAQDYHIRINIESANSIDQSFISDDCFFE